MSAAEIRKQISMFVPLSDWKAIRIEAARRGISMTELCRQWMHPQLDQLRREELEGRLGDQTSGCRP